jgi:alpha-tubulin suppressor-like RCC1 family protein
LALPLAISASSTTPISLSVGGTATITFSTTNAKGSVSFALVDPAANLGATIDSATGLLTVAPSAAGTFQAVVRATDAATGKTAEMQIQVTATAVVPPDPEPEPEPEPDIIDVSGNFAPGKIGQPVSFTPTVLDKATSAAWSDAGATFAINTDLAPYGLAFDTTSGAISGTITQAAYVQNVVISVTSKMGHADSTAPFTMILAPDQDMAFASGVTDIVKINPSTPTTKNLTVVNALGPVTYSISQKSNGLNVAVDNQVKSYTLSAVGGDYTMTVHAVDVVGRTADKNIAVNVGTFYDLDFMAIAKYNACGLSVDGALYCWGTSNPAAKQKVPTLVAGFESGVTTIAVGVSNVCAIKSGALYCVGGNAFGQIGDNTIVDKTVFTPVSGMSSGVTDVAVVGEVTGTGSDTFHVCAVKSGQVYCWGSNTSKQVANTSTTSYKVPTLVSGIAGTATKVGVGATAGTAFSCAVSSGQAYCWGSNNVGQLGVGDNTDRATPTLVSALGSTVTDIDTSMQFSCAVSANKPYCWGSNAQGQLGNGTKTQKTSPTLVSMPSANRVDVGQYGACAEVNNLWSCWGENVTTPAVVQVPYVLRYVSLGYQNTCALSNDGGYCWGSNNSYVFGDGTNVGSATPKSIPYY